MTNPEAASEPEPAGYELASLADFIRKHGRTSFDQTLADTLLDCAHLHGWWSRDCKVSHWEPDYPCDDYERAITLGIAWLKGHIEDST